MKQMLSAPIMTLLLGILLTPLSGNAMKIIQAQPSSGGKFEVSLTSVKIKRDVLTIQAIVKNVSAKKMVMEFKYKKAYYTDVENRKKYSVLKDSEGQYIAGPKRGDSYGGYFRADLEPDEQKIIWMKFPAPPVSTSVVDIFIPGFLPLEEVQLAR